MKAKAILTAALVSIFFFNNQFSSAQVNFDNKPFTIIKVLNDTKDNSTTIIWNDSRFDEVEVYKENNLFMPSTPIFEAKEMHLNDLEDGTYYVNFKKNNQILATKEFKVAQHQDMAKN
jgi:hypothetical protein